LDVIWTLVECSVKRVEHCTVITRTLTVFLPVMYVRSIEIFVVDNRCTLVNLFIVYNYLTKCFGRYCNHLHGQNRRESNIHAGMEAWLCKFIVVLIS